MDNIFVNGYMFIFNGGGNQVFVVDVYSVVFIGFDVEMNYVVSIIVVDVANNTSVLFIGMV